ncbi:MAG: universal stress protein [Desulfobacterales bacterium]|jgi:nucleotide-binding universal stress UspA family protein|nr:universal stress protein [Desulfobacterales bacterium]MDH3829435.1 universal stress protein [Desulfobacterales bacterium]MDH3876421.1 universal stress protein [Desulfobacterales bacterium]MDH4009533.1 universal stress protein [Desulfobacterales bacterium]
MIKKTEKMIVVPIDGSENALKSLDYINRIFGPKHNIKLSLVYLLPALPSILVEESRKSRETVDQLREIEKRNSQMAERILTDAKDRLMQVGFTQKTVEAVFRKIEVGVARDICAWAESHKKADAIIISSRGRSRLEAFFTGEIANKVLEFVKVCPVWMIKGRVKSKSILLAVDNSENAIRAVEHAGYMLSGSDVSVTVFHSKRDLRRFVPKEVLQEFPGVEKFWQRKAGDLVAPYMKKAREMLIEAGLAENQISVKLVDGSHSAARDILEEAEENGIGTIVLGKKGHSAVADYSMGSITKKVLDGASDMAVCIVP